MTSKILIRKATVDDLEAIHKLLCELGYKNLQISELEKVLELVLLTPDAGVLLAEVNQVALGMISFSYKTQLRVVGKILEIDELIVSENARGTGIGKMLLEEVKNISLRIGAKIIVLSTNRIRESYIRQFYTKNGFTESQSALMIMKLG